MKMKEALQRIYDAGWLHEDIARGILQQEEVELVDLEICE
jgi:hypothetical protein